MGGGTFVDDFDGSDLDTDVWVPHYLPMWSSRVESAATYTVDGSELRLTIPAEQGLWCPEDHDPPLRVSGIQSGVFSGEAGSTVGQQPFREGQLVREAQPTRWGWTPEYGLLEVRARMELSPRSMASVWMVGLEQEPAHSGEICIFEVFGDALGTDDGTPSAAVGMGLKPFRDPDLTIDGRRVRTVHKAPDYPMQMMVAVFDFPDRAAASSDPDHVPEFALDYVRGGPSAVVVSPPGP
jgi:hypothetical protein